MLEIHASHHPQLVSVAGTPGFSFSSFSASCGRSIFCEFKAALHYTVRPRHNQTQRQTKGNPLKLLLSLDDSAHLPRCILWRKTSETPCCREIEFIQNNPHEKILKVNIKTYHKERKRIYIQNFGHQPKLLFFSTLISHMIISIKKFYWVFISSQIWCQGHNKHEGQRK